MKKILGLILLLACLNANAKNIYADVNITHITPIKEDAVWTRKKQVSPRYPMKLAKSGIAGCGIFKVIVNEQGETESVELISSIPKKVIFKPSRKVIKKWKWAKTDNAIAKAEEKTIRLDYCMGGTSLEEAQQRCQSQAKLSCSV
jgi:hypothetical protein